VGAKSRRCFALVNNRYVCSEGVESMQAKWEEMKEEEQKNQSLRNKIGAKNKQKLVKSLLSQTQRRQRLLER